jgi:hypothetical protein
MIPDLANFWHQYGQHSSFSFYFVSESVFLKAKYYTSLYALPITSEMPIYSA